MENNDINTKIYIPSNYNYWGNKIRNIVECVIINAIVIPTILSLDLSIRKTLLIGIAVVIPLTVLGFVGINEESLTTALINWIRFMRNRRKLSKPDAEYIRRKDRAMMKKQSRQKGM